MQRLSLPSRAFSDRRIRGGHIRVLAAIAMLGAGALSHHQISMQSGIGERDVRRHLKELSELEYLTIANESGTKNSYAILFNDIGEGMNASPGEESAASVPLSLVPPDPPISFPLASEPKGSSDTTRARGVAENMVSIWREECGQILSVPAKLDAARIAGCDARLRDTFGRDIGQWRAYCQRIRGSPFCCGDNDRGWRADFDWALKPKTIRGVLEGKYERRLPPRKAGAADNLIEGFGRAAGLGTSGGGVDCAASDPLLDGEYVRLSA